jgi:hypothetical protein
LIFQAIHSQSSTPITPPATTAAVSRFMKVFTVAGSYPTSSLLTCDRMEPSSLSAMMRPATFSTAPVTIA